MEVDMTGFDAMREQASEGRLGLRQPRRQRQSGYARAAILSSFLALAVAPTSAQAQIFGMFGWSMPPGQVMHIIQSQGFRLAAPIYRNGRVYVADVMDEHGVRERLIVDAFSGDVLQTFVLGRPSETYDAERSAGAEPIDRGIPLTGAPQTIESQPLKPKAKARTSVTRRETSRIRSEPEARTPASDLPPSEVTKAPLPIQPSEPAVKNEPMKNEPAEASPTKGKTEPASEASPAPAPKAMPVEASPKQQAKAPAVNEMPVAPLDDAAGKKPNRSATDVPVAPLD
jgi:hypothetical protein